jgi:hypothetical protein
MNPDFDGVPLDTRTIPRDLLNIQNKERSNPFPWSGQFSPQLIEALLATYAESGTSVLDPFLGSGTVLYEAGRRSLCGFGSEINPAAFKMAQVYRLINATFDQRKMLIGQADELIHNALPCDSLFTGRKRVDSVEASLSQAANGAEPPLVKALLDGLVVLLDYRDTPVTAADVLRIWKRLRTTALELPFSNFSIDLAHCDARQLPLADDTVDFVLTSPPYINVFNYHQHYRRSVESLGWNLLTVARSEIGSNRKHRQNRFLTVIQYCLDMAGVFHELRRVCRPKARIAIILGRESNVRKTSFFNGEIVARIAVRSCGCRFESRQERVFRNRFGAMIYEDILHFSFDEAQLEPPAGIARQTLTAALSRAPAESVADLEDAIDRIGDIEPSPLYGEIARVSSARMESV